MFGKVIDWILGVKREEEPYRYHRHRAWEDRELVGEDYLHPRDRRLFRPDHITRYKPIIELGYGRGFATRQVETWVYRKQRIAELRYRAARRRELSRTWGWLNMSVKEVSELWPRSGVVSV